jgi:hypothetical protein
MNLGAWVAIVALSGGRASRSISPRGEGAATSVDNINLRWQLTTVTIQLLVHRPVSPL